jgi:lysozyme
MGTMGSDLKSMIKRHEGLRLKPYKCPAGRLTIGYGRNLEDVGITELEASFLLQQDLLRTQQDLQHALPEVLAMTENRYNALADMLFNLGLTRFLQFKKMLEALRMQDYEWAAREMLASTWAGQVGDRARELARMVREG